MGIMEGLVKMNIAFKLPNQPKPFAVDVEPNYLVRRPANAWDLKDMMVEDLTSKGNTKVEMGLMEGEKEGIAVDMIAKRTEELKQIVSLTEEFKQCEQMITKGEKLSLVCKKARSLAAILDLLEMNVALPKTIVNNNYVRTLLDVVKASLLPYLSVEPFHLQLAHRVPRARQDPDEDRLHGQACHPCRSRHREGDPVRPSHHLRHREQQGEDLRQDGVRLRP